MEPVRSHRNRAVVEAAKLHRARVRKQSGESLLEGPSLVEDAIAAGCEVVTLFASVDDENARRLADIAGTRLVLVDDRALGRLAGTETPRGPIAVFQIPDESLHTGRDLLVSWAVSDPGNVGTLIRTAAAFGWGYAYTDGSADPWSPKTLRAGAGGQFQTTVGRISGLADLGEWSTVATVPRGGLALEEIEAEQFAVLIGSEATGLPADITNSAGHLVTIDTPGRTESLNAAVAAGIVVYALSKRAGQEHGHV